MNRTSAIAVIAAVLTGVFLLLAAVAVVNSKDCDEPADKVDMFDVFCVSEKGDKTPNASYFAKITCHIPANFDTVIVSACLYQQVNSRYDQQMISYSLDEASNWNLHSINDSVVLRRQSKETGPLTLNIVVRWMSTTSPSIRYIVYDQSLKHLFHDTLKSGNIIQYKDIQRHRHLKKRDLSVAGSGYLVVANRLYLHQISLDGSRSDVVVGGLSYGVAVDFHFRNNSLFWIDSSRRAVMKSTLDGLKRSIVLDHGLTNPESLSVDWISDKLYWTDVRERRIGVLDLLDGHKYKYSLLSTDDNMSPRGIAVDPTTRTLYYTEWRSSAGVLLGRINKASMDGAGRVILHQSDVQWPYGITIDVDTQVLYWADLGLQRIEMCNAVDGSGRRVVVSSSTGVDRPYSVAVFGDMLYISDWNRDILATNKSGGQPVRTVNNTFCTYLSTFGIQVIAEERQLQVTNPCAVNNGGCSHLCLLSSTTARGYSCVCPGTTTLAVDDLSCSQLNMTSEMSFTTEGSCSLAGYTSCCNTGMCNGNPASCFCDSDCYRYSDCCSDIEVSCSRTLTEDSNAFILLANTLYIHRLSTDGSRNKTLVSSSKNIAAIDYDYRNNLMYWSTSNGNGLWRSEVNGSGAIAILRDAVQTVDDIAIDWISSKLYWTDSGPLNGIKVLDLILGHHARVVNTGQDTRPRSIVVDPINRWMYWTDSASLPKVESASMNGDNRTVLHDTGLQQPFGLTLDCGQQILYWIDAGLGRIERSNVDGSNRGVVVSSGIYTPFGISVYRTTLYFTDGGVYSVSINGGDVTTVFDSVCADTVGIEVVSAERQPIGTNPCHVRNGGCSHLCLLSSVHEAGYSCACPDGFIIGEDQLTCSSESNASAPVVPVFDHGTCEAAGYTGRCCTSGDCKGSPPTCSCDSTCVVFEDCCVDVPPSCQPAIDVLEFVNVTTNLTVVLGTQSQVTSQFHCSVRASRITNFEWTFKMSSHTSNLQTTPQQITNEVGVLDARFSIVSTDYSSVLTIGSVEFSDTGNFTCIASIDDRISPIMATAIHIVHVFPSMLIILGNNQYSEGQTMHLQCRVKCFPPPSIVWIIGNLTKSRILHTTARVSISDTYNFIYNGEPYSRSDLYINHVTSDDSGNYACLIHADSHTAVQMAVHNVTVSSTNECEQLPLVCLNGATCVHFDVGYQCLCARDYAGRDCSQRIGATWPLKRPVFISPPPSSVTPNFGEPVNITCLAEGHPAPTYKWFKDGMPITGETQPFLYISDALPSDRGNYSCRAINTEGVLSSKSTLLTIKGVFQYLVVLGCNETRFVPEELLTEDINRLYLQHQSNIYSVEFFKTCFNSSTIHLLVTMLTNMMPNNDIRTLLSSVLTNIGAVESITRHDGCELEDNTELDFGETARRQCPCQEYLLNLLSGQEAQIVCSGSYQTGVKLLLSDLSQCVTVANNVTKHLCSAAKMDHSLEQSIMVVNITAEHNLSSTVDIALLSAILEMLTDEAMLNAMVRDNYLKIIDYFQSIDHSSLATSQDMVGSSSRVLNSLERFAAGVDITEEKQFILQSFGMTIVNIVPNVFEGQTFSVFNTSGKETSNVTSGITDWGIKVTNRSAADIANDSFATLHVPKDSVSKCSLIEANQQRLAYFVFFTDSLFLSKSHWMRVESMIIAVRMNCNVSDLSTPVSIILHHNQEPSEHADCASRLKGLWSTRECHMISSRDAARDNVQCECYQFSHFGIILLTKNRFQIAVYTYLAISVSLVFLIMTLITVIAVSESWSRLERIAFLNLTLTLIFTYFLFVAGAHVTSITALCAATSALLQLLMMVFYCWTVILNLCLYLKLGEVPKQTQKILLCSSMCATWILPLVIVSLTAGVWHNYYYTDYYCSVVRWPLWFGLVTPVAMTLVVHIILIVLCFLKVLRYSKSPKYQVEKCVNSAYASAYQRLLTALTIKLVCLFGGWSLCLLSISPQLSKNSEPLQALFAMFTSAQGVLVFVYCVYSNSEAKSLWRLRKSCLKSIKLPVASNDLRTEKRVDHTGDRKPKHFTSLFHTRLKNCTEQKNVIPTNTNQAYHTVVLHNMKNTYTMTDNDAYGQGGRTRFIHIEW